MHRTTILDNGITVITSPIPSAKTAAVMVGIDVGSYFEDDTQRGLAHFLEHMVFNGTKKFPTSKDLTKVVSPKGIMPNAFTSRQYTVYQNRGHHKDINTMLEFTNQLFQHPVFPESSLEKERDTIIQEIKMSDDRPGSRARNIAWTHLYEGNQEVFQL